MLMFKSQNQCILEIVEMWVEGEERIKYNAYVSALSTINLSTGLTGWEMRILSCYGTIQ